MYKLLLFVCVGCSAAETRPAGPRTLSVTVAADGSFSPQTLSIYSGDTVEWTFHDRTDAVVPSRTSDCASALPWEESGFAGPRPQAPSGVYTLSPLAGTMATQESTWASPQLTGVFIRLLWNQLQPSAGSYDFSVLDREVDQAVKHGKLYSLGIKAGSDGTPGWIFSEGVTRLHFQDHGGGEVPGCGVMMNLGSPTDAKYQELYFALLTEVANHLKARGDWYRPLAYIKLSGANLFSHENRLPKFCDPGCLCNTQIFAEAGYRPSGLYAFYSAQTALLAGLFPGKTMSYALIQDGFPAVNEAGEWETETGMTSGSMGLPKGSEQTEEILKQGALEWGNLFAVQHNGLKAQPPGSSCPNAGQHPAMPPFGQVGSGCPNRWALGSGSQGQPTGFQTSNNSEVVNAADLDATFDNLMLNSDGMFLEIYEERFQEAEASPVGKTLAERAEELHARRRDPAIFPSLPDPFPTTHRHTFTATAKETLSYVNPRACKSGVLELSP